MSRMSVNSNHFREGEQEIIDTVWLFERKHCLDFDRDVFGQGTHADRAAGANPFFRSPNLGEKLAATVDDVRMLFEFGCAIDHAEYLDDLLDAVETPECCSQAGEDGQTGLMSRRLAGSQIK